MAQQVFARCKFFLEVVYIALPDCCFCSQQSDYACLCNRGRRFDCGHRAYYRYFEHIAHHTQRNRAGRIAGNAGEARIISFAHTAQQAGNARSNLRL